LAFTIDCGVASGFLPLTETVTAATGNPGFCPAEETISTARIITTHKGRISRITTGKVAWYTGTIE
jgi:hypothetical protein